MAKGDHIILRVEAVIAKREPTELNPHPISLSISGRAYPRVSSGSRFGYAGSFSTVEEAEGALKRYLNDLVDWLRKSYFRPVRLRLTLRNEVEGVESREVETFGA